MAPVGQTKFDALPGRVQEALGELAGAAKEGLLALNVGVGLSVLTGLMAEEVEGRGRPEGPPRRRLDLGRRPGVLTTHRYLPVPSAPERRGPLASRRG